ncbi:MAG: VanZ family protein [Prevotellaceae bacterium]|nr:VanZ family protein [Prevotellaceae bacterium]
MKTYPLTLLMLAAIAVASLIPIPKTPLQEVPFYDKWAHFLMYALLCLAVWADYLRRHKRVRWAAALPLTVVFPVLVSGLLELAQAYLTTYRSGDWLDFAANSVGVLLATLVMCLFLALRGKRKGRSCPKT